MTKLMQLTSLTVLILLVSGCSYKDNLLTPTKPKVDETLEVVDSSSIRSISDINAIAFEWRKVDDPRVTGYYFYRANLEKDGGKLKLISTVKNKYTTHYVDEDLDSNTQYVYKISSATKNEVESRTTNNYIVKTLPKMEGVSFIQAISNLPKQIKIIWRPHSNERIESYKIYRTTPQTSEWDKLKTIDGRLQAEFIDGNLDNNVIYHYKIVAITFDGISSLPSKIVKAQTKALPAGILNLNISNNLPRKIKLNWQPSESSDVVRYNIYRSYNTNSYFNNINSVDAQTLQFDDFINEDGKVYFYKVSSIDKDGLESDLSINSVMGVTLSKLNKPIITLAQIQGKRAILNWQAGDKRAVSYIIHKTIKENFLNSKTIKFEGINNLRFEDKDIVRGVEYSYSIQSVDKFGIVSKETNKAELVLPKLRKIN